jgi:ribosomal protein S21
MAVWAVRRKGETNEQLMKRFKKQSQNARMIQKKRSGRFYQKPKSRRRIRDEALARAKYRQVREKEKLYL